METMTTALANLTKTADNGRTVRVDANRLNDHAVKVFDDRLARAVEASVSSVEGTWRASAARPPSSGTQKVSEAVQRIERILDKANERSVAAVGRAKRRVEALENVASRGPPSGDYACHCSRWQRCSSSSEASRCESSGVFHALRFGPFLGWAWASFTAASTWWAKTLIALGTFGGVGAFASLVWWEARRIGEEYGRW